MTKKDLEAVGVCCTTCSNDLKIRRLRDGKVFVFPCEACLEEERKDGYEEGREVGYDNGYEDGFDTGSGADKA
jgi:hypothetical protein